jgi:23S rRNA pseudoU1915 N3-methylase RlmH
MPDRQPNEAMVRFLLSEFVKQQSARTSRSLSDEAEIPEAPKEQDQLSALKRERRTKVHEAIQQGAELAILDREGRLRAEHLFARGLIDSTGKVIQDIFGRRVQCRP